MIEVDPYCCEVGWDAVCIEMYEYCSQGVTSVEALGYNSIQIWPNPTSGVFNFQAPAEAFADVYSHSGQLVMSWQGSREIDLTSLRNGLYEIVIHYKGRVRVERIVKQ